MLRKITDYKHDYHSFLGAYAKFINARNVVEIGVQTGDCATFLVDAVTINGGKYYVTIFGNLLVYIIPIMLMLMIYDTN